MSDLGPDLWNNAPDASSPVADLRAWLAVMSATVASWQVKANQEDWSLRFATLQNAISDALTALPESDIFPRKSALVIYNQACDLYQSTKDKLALSQDWFLTASQQSGASSVAFLDQLMAYLRQAGIGLGAIAVGLVVLVVVLKFI